MQTIETELHYKFGAFLLVAFTDETNFVHVTSHSLDVPLIKHELALKIGKTISEFRLLEPKMHESALREIDRLTVVQFLEAT